MAQQQLRRMLNGLPKPFVDIARRCEPHGWDDASQGTHADVLNGILTALAQDTTERIDLYLDDSGDGVRVRFTIDRSGGSVCIRADTTTFSVSAEKDYEGFWSGSTESEDVVDASRLQFVDRQGKARTMNLRKWVGVLTLLTS